MLNSQNILRAVPPHTSQNIGLFLVRFFDARSLALFSDVYLSKVIDIELHLVMGDHYLVYSGLCIRISEK